MADTPRLWARNVRRRSPVSVENICTIPSASSPRPQKTTGAAGDTATLTASLGPSKLRSGAPPSSASNILTLPSKEAVKKRFPSCDMQHAYRPSLFKGLVLPLNTQTCSKPGTVNFLPTLLSAVKRCLPSGAMHTEQTHPWCGRLLTNMPVSSRQTLAVSSLTAVMRYSAVTQAQFGWPISPAKVRRHLPVLSSHILAVPSSDVVKSRVPSGDRQQDQRESVWPSKVRNKLPDFMDHIWAVLSADAVMTKKFAWLASITGMPPLCKQHMPLNSPLPSSNWRFEASTLPLDS
mmetsp:Transcript_78512/g.230274  ORF Transcript_78512/g.230274 Transcript_78512/m.230274 type:complete len:291 (+) Transcript_78512:226-1098(+)